MEGLLYLFLNTVWPFLKQTAVLWVPAVSAIFAIDWWLEYVQKNTILKMKWTLLHLKIPQNVPKTPQAMELVLNTLHQGGGPGNWYERYWEGKVAPWSSLEIVSIEGTVYFFVHIPTAWKDMLEAQIYAQYPEVEIEEVEDYTKFVPPYDPDNGWEYKGVELKLDKDDWIPIKTYVDYGLDAKGLSLDEEQRIDPLTPLIEMLGSMGKGEQMWIQMIIRGGAKRWMNDKGEEEDWQKQGRKALDKLMEKYATSEATEKDAEGKEKKTKVGGYKNLPPHLKQQVDSAERNLEKFGFDFGMRAMYIAQPEKSKSMRMPAEFTNAIKQFKSPNLNSFAIATKTDGFDFKWMDSNNERRNKRRKKMFKLYVERSWFVWPGDKKPAGTLTTEEIATLFHFPGQVSTTPTFERIEARKSEPPANLPI